MIIRLLTTICLCCLLGVSAAAFAQEQDPFKTNIRPTEPLSPAEEQASFQLPPGFEVQLFAAEPDILKPLNMAFDARGRLWITETIEYPFPVTGDRKGRDNIKILEDTTGDGRADRITTFADDLNIPIGLYPFQNSAVVFSIPNIWRLEDTNGDGRADRREKLYGPMGFERDTHGLNNSFRRGFDGWLYACHGYNNETTVAGADGHTIHMQSGNTYRMRLDGSRIEQFTWGQVNPFGMALDPLGNLFTADCHSKPIYQLLRGGNYPSFGKPHNGLGFVQPMMDHLHGSTAIAGITYYTGENFPPAYRGNVFTGNVMTSRVNRDSLAFNGSTITAHEEPDFISTSDPWFRPVDIRMGPDGALYVADFYNRVIGHYEVPLDDPNRDRHRGRIWRIRYTGDGAHSKPATRPADLSRANVNQLLASLSDSNLTLRQLAANELVDRIGTDAVSPAREYFRNSENPHARSHLLWVMQRLGALELPDLESAAQDSRRDVRVHAMRVLSESADWTPSHRELALAGLSDDDAFVQRAAADALGQHPQYENIRLLLTALHLVPAADNHLEYTLRMSLRHQLLDEGAFGHLAGETLNEADSRAIAGVAISITSPQAGAFLLDFVQEYPVPRATLAEYLRHAARYISLAQTAKLAEFAREKFADDLDFQTTLLQSIHAGLERRGVDANAAVVAWAEELATSLLNSIDDNARLWFNTPVPNQRSLDNPWVIQKRKSADGDEQSWFLCSLPWGEQLTGRLASPTFTIPKKLSFYLAGHDGFPDKPLNNKNIIQLRSVDGNTVLKDTAPPRNDVAQRVEWDLTEYAGEQGYLEVVDGDAARAFAWLAIGRFEPPVISTPKLDPRTRSQREQAAGKLAGDFQLQPLRHRLEEMLVAASTEAATRAVIAQSLVEFEPNSLAAAFAPLAGEVTLPADLRQRMAQTIVTREPEELQKLLGDLFQVVPLRLQTELAERLVNDAPGAEALLQLVQQGRAAARLLLQPRVNSQLAALNNKDVARRIEDLTSGLPSENDAIQKSIAARLKEHAAAEKSIAKGAEVFTKHCAACHQVDGKGPVLGPQLDGIGNRGAERLVEDVLDPNRNVDVAFRTTTLVLKNGMVKAGLARREEGALLVLADEKGKEFTVPLTNIDEKVKSKLSLMPANVVEIVSPTDFHHLLAFLLSKTRKPVGDES